MATLSVNSTCREGLDQYLGGKDERPLGYATRVRREGDRFVVRLHNTDIMTWDPDGSVTLNTGGWKTVTTKDRFKRLLPQGWGVWSEKGSWGVYFQGSYVRGFEDGMKIGPGTRIEGGLDPEQEKQEKRLRTHVARWAKRFIRAFANGDVPSPGLGDCLYCQGLAGAKIEFGTLNQVPGGGLELVPGIPTRHLMSHMRFEQEKLHESERETEDYFVPSLLHAAVRAFPVPPIAQWCLASHWGGEGARFPFEALHFGQDSVAFFHLEKSLRKFLFRLLGLAR